jgi:hypothetical protein
MTTPLKDIEMLSYLNDPAVKAKYVARFEAHRKADEVIQGQGFKNGRGCFVGCTLDAYKHERFPIELGWPEWLARLADTIFEGIPANDAPQFGTDLLEAVPVGVNLDPVRARFLLTVQRRNLTRMESNKDKAALEVVAAIKTVIGLLEKDEPADSAAESAARSAAWSAWSAAESAWSAAESAESAAESAARSAESAARSAAWSAARSAARSARSARSAAESAWSAAESARSAEYKLMRDDLLAICRELATV